MKPEDQQNRQAAVSATVEATGASPTAVGEDSHAVCGSLVVMERAEDEVAINAESSSKSTDTRIHTDNDSNDCGTEKDPTMDKATREPDQTEADHPTMTDDATKASPASSGNQMDECQELEPVDPQNSERAVLSDDSSRNRNHSASANATDYGTSTSRHNHNHHNTNATCSQQWTAAIDAVRFQICRFLKVITHQAATHPWTCIIGIAMLSLGLLLAGFFTNFRIETDGEILWPPRGSTTQLHQDWIVYHSDFAKELEYSVNYIHADGANLMEDAQESVSRAFEVVETVRNLPDYERICGEPYTDPVTNVTMECVQHGVIDFWLQSVKLFDYVVESEDDVVRAMSAEYYPYGRAVDSLRIYGNPVYEVDADGNQTLATAQAYRIDMGYPIWDAAIEFLIPVMDAFQDLQDEWDVRDKDSPIKYHVEFFTSRSFDDEFERAIVNDTPLVPGAFIVMSAFCCLVFARWDRVRSQALLGVGAVTAVLLSIMTGYGILFLAGVPLTSATQIVVFVMFGIGLDDAFIISGAYSRTDPWKDPVERVADTIDDIGLSIALTTLTSALAFMLGSISSITAVYWLCLYAFPTIIIDFFYQITFFVCLIVIDERRMQGRRMDCLVCVTVRQEKDGEANDDDDNNHATQMDTVPADIMDGDVDKPTSTNSGPSTPSTSSLLMTWYANKLLQPEAKVFVLVVFTALLGACIYGTTQLRQEMDFKELVPSDSYVVKYFDAHETFASSTGISGMAYFRDVDQSDPVIRRQMQSYLDDLISSTVIQDQPPYFWVVDFEAFVAEHFDGTNQTATFNEQMGAFLEDPLFNFLYKDNIVRDELTGNITSSRVATHIDVDLSDSRFLQNLLQMIRGVEGDQLLNQGLPEGDYRFFIYEPNMNMWEFYSVVPGELTFSTIVSVIAVSVIGLLFIPHWTAVFFVLPSIVTVYVDLLGMLYFLGVAVNPVSYITLVMSVGLLVDFIMHILLRYYECRGRREDRVKETLRTLGSSILIGGISTFLGVMLLAFSVSEIFMTIFRAFIALVVLGCSYGLILLPVVLSMIGPEDDDEAAEDQIPLAITKDHEEKNSDTNKCPSQSEESEAAAEDDEVITDEIWV